GRRGEIERDHPAAGDVGVDGCLPQRPRAAIVDVRDGERSRGIRGNRDQKNHSGNADDAHRFLPTAGALTDQPLIRTRSKGCLDDLDQLSCLPPSALAYFAKTSSTGTILTFSALMPSFIAPMTL